jgi:hypothetical protein
VAVNLPDRKHVERLKGEGLVTPSALQDFIYYYEPHSEGGSAAFRKLLSAVLSEHYERLLQVSMDGLDEIRDCDKCDLCEDHHG